MVIIDKITDFEGVQTFLDSQPFIGIVVWILSLIGVIVGLIISLASSIKRLHDLDKSGWFILLNFVPLVNIWMLIWLWFIKGTSGKNNYGEDPLNNQPQTKV